MISRISDYWPLLALMTIGYVIGVVILVHQRRFVLLVVSLVGGAVLGWWSLQYWPCCP